MAFYPPSATAKELTLTTNVQLDYPYSANVNNVTVADMMDVSATVNNLKIILPNSLLTGPGFAVTFNNVGTHSFNVVLYDKVTVLQNVAQGAVVTMYLYNNSTENGNWRVIPFGGGINAISSLNLTSSDNSIIVSNGAITPPGGTMNINLPPITSAITTLNSNIPGIVVINQANNEPWSVVNLISGNNITITNPDCSTGEPIFNLNDNIAVTQIRSGNIIINNNLITNADSGEILNIVSNGTNSFINMNSILIDAQGNVSDINNLTITGTFKAPNGVKAWCRFNNTSGTLALLSSYNVSSVNHTTNNYQYEILFTTPMQTVNYAVFISCANNNSTPPIQTRIGYDIIKQLNSVTIVVADGAGEMSTDFPEGLSVMILSLT